MLILNKSEAFVLRWLAREDASLLGECKGAALDMLVHLGLAEITAHRTPAEYSLVAVTEAGWAVLKEIGREV